MGREIDHDIISHIASLARIELNEKGVESFTRQFVRIIDYFDKLAQLDTEGVEPLTHAVELSNVLADDTSSPSLSKDEALANAPDQDGSFFKVPKVLGDS
jgi:aspartyl-tRNA(Asn)/glutamyl-tRNA(Gln) amidotransferase subunit C